MWGFCPFTVRLRRGNTHPRKQAAVDVTTSGESGDHQSPRSNAGVWATNREKP
jgi:hypothetical protein